MTRRRPAVVALDVNETLLDLAPVRAALVEAGQPESLLRAVFARTLLTGFAATVVGDWCAFRDAFDTNATGPYLLTKALIGLLRKSANPRIVNVSSEAGSLASMNGGAPAYRVSKAALNALTRTLASELRRDRVLVNAICPGWVATDMGGAGGRPVEDGAAGVVWAATLPDDGPTGGFFRDAQPVPW